jgi:DNA-binding NtrC family response regulator
MNAHILVVDDEPAILEITATILEMAGCRTVRVPNGRQAMAKLARQSFDLIVTDLYMPELDGLELIQRVQARAEPIPIIVVSGGGAFGFDMMGAARNLGALATLPKPIKPDDLLAAVAKILSRGGQAAPRQRGLGSAHPGASPENKPRTNPGTTAVAGLT